MKVGVPKETASGECRVALAPGEVGKLKKAGLDVVVERGAGDAAFFPDAAYEKAGAEFGDAAAALSADIVLKIDTPTPDQIGQMKEGASSFSFLASWSNPDAVEAFNGKKVSAFSMEQVPRITRAQSMDALSSQATIAGYQAVLMGTQHLGRILPMLVTAAGTLTPAKVLVIGAGVAGLQALGTARRLGAIVSGFDVRLAAAEQVESMGAKFVGRELLEEGAEDKGGYAKAQGEEKDEAVRQMLQKHCGDSQLVVTTAAIPRRTAPLLIPKASVEAMAPGSVVVDLAAETGGNCELTKAGEVVVHNGVTILGPAKLPATIPNHASQMFSRNIVTLLLSMVKEGALALDFEDEVVAGCCVTHEGAARSQS